MKQVLKRAMFKENKSKHYQKMYSVFGNSDEFDEKTLLFSQDVI